jgi:Domain of unknown function (DUF4390)
MKTISGKPALLKKMSNFLNMRIVGGKKVFVLAVILIVNFIFCVNLFAAQEAVISNVQLTNTRDDLIVYFDVKNAFTDEISRAVLKGVPASFSFYIKLEQMNRNIFFDTDISDYKVTSTLKYNILKKEFVVSRPWKNGKPYITDSFEEAKKAMTEVDNLFITGLSNLVKGKNYELEIKAKLDKVTLPLYLHYVFFFVSFWDFETDKHVTKFTY